MNNNVVLLVNDVYICVAFERRKKRRLMSSSFKAWCQITERTSLGGAGAGSEMQALEIKVDRYKAIETHLNKENELLKESVDEYSGLVVEYEKAIAEEQQTVRTLQHNLQEKNKTLMEMVHIYVNYLL